MFLFSFSFQPYFPRYLTTFQSSGKKNIFSFRVGFKKHSVDTLPSRKKYIFVSVYYCMGIQSTLDIHRKKIFSFLTTVLLWCIGRTQKNNRHSTSTDKTTTILLWYTVHGTWKNVVTLDPYWSFVSVQKQHLFLTTVQYYYGTWHLEKTQSALYPHRKKSTFVSGYCIILWCMKKSISPKPHRKYIFSTWKFFNQH